MLFRAKPRIILQFSFIVLRIPWSSYLFDFPPLGLNCVSLYSYGEVLIPDPAWMSVLEIGHLEVIKLKGVLRVGPNPIWLAIV